MIRLVLAAGATAVLGLPLAMLAGRSGATPAAGGVVDPAALAGRIPAVMLDAYLSASAAWEVDWALLAAVGKVECDHGRYPGAGCNPPGTVNHAGARGPMQFLGSTWRHDAPRHAADVAGPPAPDGAGYATDGNGDGIADPWQLLDATHAAARYLQVLGVGDDPWEAARAYNAGPASTPPLGAGYADRVVAIAADYRTAAGASGAVSVGGWALPFDRDGLDTRAEEKGVAPLSLLVKPHHSGRIAADIPLPVGTPVRAVRAGTVRVAGIGGACGTTLILDLDDGSGAGGSATYCHLSSLTVRAGDEVAAGQPVGVSGGMPGTPGAGSSTGPHLHLHLDSGAGRRCPQPLLAALWNRTTQPGLDQLPTTGCTYTASALAGAAP